MSDIKEDEVKSKLLDEESGDQEEVTVEGISDADDEEKLKSISAMVSAGIQKKYGRKPLTKKPVVVLMGGAKKDIPEGLLELAQDKGEKEAVPMVLTIENGQPKHVQASVEDYLDSKGIQHTDDMTRFIDSLEE